uniref:Uncharacterized protein n=1 Tax=Sinocyclocheilus anshuiensis TaxID=1608454 RepID=A0A671K014_9TELE
MSAHAMEMSHLNALAVHRMSFAMEEFPQMLDCDSARSVLQRKRQFSCDKIAEEVDEEGPFTVEEDKARRTFLQSLESLRRSLLWFYAYENNCFIFCLYMIFI